MCNNGGPKRGKHYSRTRPRRSQLTQTQWAKVYAVQEAIDATTDALEFTNAMDAGIKALKDIQEAYTKPAPGHVRAEARYRDKIARLVELVSELEDIQARDDESWEALYQDALDLDWDIPSK